jgi:hypothetical protein
MLTQDQKNNFKTPFVAAFVNGEEEVDAQPLQLDGQGNLKTTGGAPAQLSINEGGEKILLTSSNLQGNGVSNANDNFLIVGGIANVGDDPSYQSGKFRAMSTDLGGAPDQGGLQAYAINDNASCIFVEADDSNIVAIMQQAMYDLIQNAQAGGFKRVYNVTQQIVALTDVGGGTNGKYKIIVSAYFGN